MNTEGRYEVQMRVGAEDDNFAGNVTVMRTDDLGEAIAEMKTLYMLNKDMDYFRASQVNDLTNMRRIAFNTRNEVKI